MAPLRCQFNKSPYQHKIDRLKYINFFVPFEFDYKKAP